MKVVSRAGFAVFAFLLISQVGCQTNADREAETQKLVATVGSTPPDKVAVFKEKFRKAYDSKLEKKLGIASLTRLKELEKRVDKLEAELDAISKESEEWTELLKEANAQIKGYRADASAELLKLQKEVDDNLKVTNDQLQRLEDRIKAKTQ